MTRIPWSLLCAIDIVTLVAVSQHTEPPNLYIITHPYLTIALPSNKTHGFCHIIWNLRSQDLDPDISSSKLIRWSLVLMSRLSALEKINSPSPLSNHLPIIIGLKLGLLFIYPVLCWDVSEWFSLGLGHGVTIDACFYKQVPWGLEEDVSLCSFINHCSYNLSSRSSSMVIYA